MYAIALGPEIWAAAGLTIAVLVLFGIYGGR